MSRRKKGRIAISYHKRQKDFVVYFGEGTGGGHMGAYLLNHLSEKRPGFFANQPMRESLFELMEAEGWDTKSVKISFERKKSEPSTEN